MMTTGAINEKAVERINQDETELNEAGLFFTQPTLYMFGTPLAQSGKDGYQFSRLAFDKRDFADVVAEQAYAAVRGQERVEKPVTLCNLSMIPNTGKITRGGGAMPCSQLAIGQLVRLAGALGGAGSYLASCPTELRATNFNFWMSTQKALDTEAVLRTMLEKTRESGEIVRGCYGVVGTRYKVYDADQVIKSFMQFAPPESKGEFKMEGPRWKFTIHFHSAFQADDLAVGDIFRGVVWVEGRDDGSGSIKVGVGVERARCVNLTTIWAKQIKGVRHTAREIATKLEALMKQALKAIEGFSSKWAEASKDSIISGVYEGVEPKYIFEKLVEKRLVHATGCNSEDLVERLVHAWNMEPGYTRADISNAITRAAHTETWKSAWTCEELEEQGGELLYNYVHLSPPAPETPNNGMLLEVL